MKKPVKPWRDVTESVGEETTCLDYGDECQVASDFYDAGYDAAVKEYEPMLRECEKTEDDLTKIITDLIAELRDEMWKGEDMDAEIAITRAEARLREVQGE